MQPAYDGMQDATGCMRPAGSLLAGRMHLQCEPGIRESSISCIFYVNVECVCFMFSVLLCNFIVCASATLINNTYLLTYLLTAVWKTVQCHTYSIHELNTEKKSNMEYLLGISTVHAHYTCRPGTHMPIRSMPKAMTLLLNSVGGGPVRD